MNARPDTSAGHVWRLERLSPEWAACIKCGVDWSAYRTLEPYQLKPRTKRNKWRVWPTAPKCTGYPR